MSHYPPITPHLAITDVASALDFYAKAFGAEERLRLTLPDGTIAHAEMTVEGGLVTLGAAIPAYGLRGAGPGPPGAGRDHRLRPGRRRRGTPARSAPAPPR